MRSMLGRETEKMLNHERAQLTELAVALEQAGIRSWDCELMSVRLTKDGLFPRVDSEARLFRLTPEILVRYHAALPLATVTFKDSRYVVEMYQKGIVEPLSVKVIYVIGVVDLFTRAREEIQERETRNDAVQARDCRQANGPDRQGLTSVTRSRFRKRRPGARSISKSSLSEIAISVDTRDA